MSVIDTLKEELEAKRREALAIEQAIALLEGQSFVIADRQATLPTRTDFKGLGIADAATRFIKEVGEPRETREIADALLARGFETKSKNFVATVYATLTNSKQFRRTKDDRWEPIGEKG